LHNGGISTSDQILGDGTKIDWFLYLLKITWIDVRLQQWGKGT